MLFIVFKFILYTRYIINCFIYSPHDDNKRSYNNNRIRDHIKYDIR